MTQWRRGDVFVFKLDPAVGAVMGKTRPCVVIQNNKANKESDTTLVAPISGAEHLEHHVPPVVVLIPEGEGGLNKRSAVICNQIRTFDKSQMGERWGRLSDATMRKVDAALKISLGLTGPSAKRTEGDRFQQFDKASQ